MRTLSLLWLSLAFIAGILLAGEVTQSVSAWLILAAVCLLAGVITFFATRRRVSQTSSRISLAPFLFAALFLGAARYQYNVPEITPSFIAWYNDRDYQVLVTGVVVESPDLRDTYQNLRIQVEAVDTGNLQPLPVSGLVLARLPDGEIYAYGDRLRLRGTLETPPEDEEFSYRDYLARHGIHSLMGDAEATRLPGRGGNDFLAAVYALKGRALENIYRIFPDPEASLLAGILLGVESGLPPGLQQAFKDTGTAHIIAISGFNIAIIAGLFFNLFGRAFGQLRGALLAAAGIALYTLLVGADAAVVRAAIMGGLSLFARQVGRRQDGLNTLAFTAAVMAAWNPLVLGDVGFQLSFGATLGLILYAQPMQDWFTGLLSRYTAPGTAQKIAGPVGEYFLFTLAAQLTTLPIMAYHFKRISLVALVANPFILPVQPPVMIVSGLALLLSLVLLPLGQIAALAAWPFSAYTIRMVEFFHRMPNGVIILGDLNLLFVIVFYAALLFWTFGRSRLKDIRPVWKPATALTTLSLLTFLVWRQAFSIPDGNLHITFLDVGSGDAVLIQTPSGRTVLVDGGSSPALLSDGLGRRLPPLERGLDWLVVAAPQENQIGALPRVLERFPPKNVLWAGNRAASYASRDLDKWLTREGIPVTPALTGHTLDLGDGARLEVLAAGPRGAVLLVAWQEFRLLLPVGVDFDAFESLKYGSALGPVSALMLAESGYAPANPPEWIDALNPQMLILSVAAADRYGMPDEKLLESLADYTLLRTDQNGWIHIWTDGVNLRVASQRPGIEFPTPGPGLQSESAGPVDEYSKDAVPPGMPDENLDDDLQVEPGDEFEDDLQVEPGDEYLEDDIQIEPEEGDEMEWLDDDYPEDDTPSGP